MYILKNALHNLGRNKGRNLLIGFIILAIILAVSVSIVINTTVGSITREYMDKFGAEITLFFDSDIAQKYSNLQHPTVEQKMDIGKSDLLQKTDYELSLSVVLKELKALDGDAVNNQSGLIVDNGDQLTTNAKVKASSHAQISEEFASGKREITSGREFQGADECIVSEQFAELNGLSVGDTVTVTGPDKNSLNPYTFTISGIYRDTLEGGIPGFQHPLFNRSNEIITDIDTAMAMEQFAVTGELSATYYLKDPSLLGAFQQEARGKGLPEYYRATIDENEYNRIVGPVEGIADIVTIFLAVVLVFGGIILLFLSIMSIRERKYEIGVLRAMGMRRLKVIVGLVCESLMIAGICLVVGLGVSTTLSQPIADTLLQNQIQIAEEQDKNTGIIELVPGEEKPGAISEIPIQLTAEAVLQISSLALLLVLLSSIVGIAYITRFEPMKILSERG